MLVNGVGMSAFLGGGGVVLEAAKAQSSGTPAPSSAAEPRKAEEQFKNILVLKGIPADQLIPGMQFITVSLGVECEFCHVEAASKKTTKSPTHHPRKIRKTFT